MQLVSEGGLAFCGWRWGGLAVVVGVGWASNVWLEVGLGGLGSSLHWRWGRLAACGWRWGGLAAYGGRWGTFLESSLYRFNK